MAKFGDGLQVFFVMALAMGFLDQEMECAFFFGILHFDVGEDLVYDIARHVDSSVHMFEDWGLQFPKTEDGRYVREGKWRVMIHGDSYKPIFADAAKKAIGSENVYQRVFVSHLLKDKRRATNSTEDKHIL